MSAVLDRIQKGLLDKIAGLIDLPTGAFNIRVNGHSPMRNSTKNVKITSKEDGTGLDIRIKDNTKGESVHIPVILSQTGLSEKVYNDFYIGENCDVVIIAGCGIHNGGGENAQHDGIHRFFIGKNTRLTYTEKHYGDGDGAGERIMNPQTLIHAGENTVFEMETVQIEGVDSTVRLTTAELAANAKLIINERLMTHGKQYAKSEFSIDMKGEGSGSTVSSRSVAKDESSQLFISHVIGNAACSGHSECDAIIMDNARIDAVPEIIANHPDASLIHEAAIGKIAGEQITKLLTLGLTEAEAEQQIINGFLG